VEPTEPQLKAKATEVIAKKAGLSTRTFERGKKIMEKASEDDKQKLRDGKISIAKVYQEIVTAEKPPEQELSGESVKAQESARDLKNKAELLSLLERLQKEELFCPACGTSMLECSHCHKTLHALLQPKKAEK
jgi:hypothetical protein